MKQTSSKARDDILSDIARVHLDLTTLESRKMDGLDFKEHSVWGVKAALIAAYEAGRNSK